MSEAVIEVFECRQRLTLVDKLRLSLLVVKENGPTWTFWWGLYYSSTALANFVSKRMHDLRQKKNVPGMNAVAVNRYVWNSWRWNTQGDEWTTSPEWIHSLVERIIERYVPKTSQIVEIGVGAGRWTSILQPIASRLIGVDISTKCIELCQARFSGCTNIEFRLSKGCDLTGITDASIDAVVSMDSFVHINSPEVRGYAREFQRVMKPGAYGMIQHGSSAGRSGGCRSDITGELFQSILMENSLEIVEQFDAWNDNGRTFEVSIYGDMVTVFRKKDSSAYFL